MRDGNSVGEFYLEMAGDLESGDENEEKFERFERSEMSCNLFFPL